MRQASFILVMSLLIGFSLAIDINLEGKPTFPPEEESKIQLLFCKLFWDMAGFCYCGGREGGRDGGRDGGREGGRDGGSRTSFFYVSKICITDIRKDEFGI